METSPRGACARIRSPLCDFSNPADVSRVMASDEGADPLAAPLDEGVEAGGVGVGVGVVVGVGVGVGPGLVTVFTVMLTEELPVLGLPAASVKVPAPTESTPSAVLLRVGMKVAV